MTSIIPQKFNNSLELISTITWRDVFLNWKEDECAQKSWQGHWKERGFASWDEWRNDCVRDISPNEKEWMLYRINDVHTTIKNFMGVPSRGWSTKCYNGEVTKRIGEILTCDTVQENSKVLNITENFPRKTMLIGVVCDNEIVLIEGMHRSLALAMMDSGAPYDVQIAIAVHDQPMELYGTGDIKK